MLFRTHKTLSSLREELDDHLDAINDNCRDVADVHEIASKLDEKIERLSTRMDELYLLLGAEAELSSAEAALQAFLQVPRTLASIEHFVGVSASRVEHTLRILLLKGVAVHQFIEDGIVYFTTNIASKDHVSLNNYF